MTNVLKGTAVIFMFVHHMFTFPRWYIDAISYPELKEFASFFCSPFKLCVGIFAFLTGYGYFFKKDKNLWYSLRKIILFLIRYWSIYIPLLILAVILGCYKFQLMDFVLELFALKRPIMYFCWYVYFYIVAMLILPLLVCLTRNHPIGIALGGVVVLNYFCSLLWQCLADNMARSVVSDFRTWFPCIVIGYLFAQLDLYHRVFERITKLIKVKYILVIVWTAMVLIPFVSRHYNAYQNIGKISLGDWNLNFRMNMDIIYVPIFIYGIVKLINLIPFARPSHILEELGKYSACMWFWHCAFFNVCKEYTQPILYFLKSPLLVIIFGVCICYSLSRMWKILIIQKLTSIAHLCTTAIQAAINNK